MRAGPLTFSRRDDGRVLAGVAGGFARQHGVDPWVVRGALVVLTFAAGLGLVLYALGAVIAEPDDAELDPPTPTDPRRQLAVASVTLGLLLMVRSTGLWLGDEVMVPLVVVVTGTVVLGLRRPDRVEGQPGVLGEVLAGRHARARLLVGTGLVALGLVMVGLGDSVSGTVRVGVFASAFSVVGVALLVGPWIARTAQAAAEERRQRIRAQEREAMAAHLHDSVLQTLALIQRTADDPRRTASLARRQEHELRAWLYGTDVLGPPRFAAALADVARDVEQRYDVRIDVVAVGDAPMDDELSAVCAAVREACVNAAKHSGESQASVYAEVGADEVEAFVRDRGVGFDHAARGADRRGIADSIIGRIEAAGGVATVDSSPGGGTEVRVSVPRRVVDGTVSS